MLDELKARLRRHEGVIPHMYLDTLGYVTAAVGHLLSTAASAEALAFVTPSGAKATADQIRAEYQAVQALEPGKLPPYYAQRTTLRLPADAVDAVLDADVGVFAAALDRLLPGFDAFPETAREALLDMAFQLGPGGLIQKFPHLIQSVKARDWHTCAGICHRAGIEEWRNTATADLFNRATQEAA